MHIYLCTYINIVGLVEDSDQDEVDIYASDEHQYSTFVPAYTKKKILNGIPHKQKRYCTHTALVHPM